MIDEFFFLGSTVPVGSWICPSEACFTECAVPFIDFADPWAVFFDWVDADAAAVGDEEEVTELEMPN